MDELTARPFDERALGDAQFISAREDGLRSVPKVVLVNELPAWLSVQQAAAYCGVDHGEMYHKMLRNLEIRRIGVRGGASPLGRLIRVERGSLLMLRGGADVPSARASSLGDADAGRWSRSSPGR
jgi:hypothetical protein